MWRAVFVIALITVVMTLVEYVTGLIFIVGLKVKLWDYSKRPGNIQGIICPLFTFFWGVIGAAYCLFVHPLLMKAVAWINLNEIYSFFIGMYYGILVIDIFYSFNIVNKIRAWAKEKNVTVKLEEFRLSVKLKAEQIKQKTNFLLSFKTKNSLNEELDEYNNRENERQNCIKS